MSKISVVIMVKDEEKTIIDTLRSTIGFVSRLFILDTGSEDDTINVIKVFCQVNKLKLHLFQKKWEEFDFSIARNYLLANVNMLLRHEKNHWLLLLDANDIVTGITSEKEHDLNSTSNAFLIKQIWTQKGITNDFFNIRLIKANSMWKYQYAVHEILTHPSVSSTPDILDGVIISQERDLDNIKTEKRLPKDIKVLEKNQEDPRNVFYQAQTHFCLKEFEAAKKCYLKRLTMADKKILDEEIYLSHFRLGDVETILEQHFLFAIKHYENAYDYSCRLYNAPRAEPLYAIAQAYKYRNPFVSLDYIRRCCDLPDTNALLLVNKQIYDVDRWEFMRVNIEVVKGLAPDNNRLCETLGYDINTLKPILCPK